MFGSYKDSFRSLIQSRLSLGAFLTSWQNQDIQNEGTKMVAVWRSYRYRRVTVFLPASRKSFVDKLHRHILSAVNNL